MPNWRARDEKRAKAVEEYEHQRHAEMEAEAERFNDYKAGVLPPEAPLDEAVAYLLQRVAPLDDAVVYLLRRVAELEERLAAARGAPPAHGQGRCGDE